MSDEHPIHQAKRIYQVSDLNQGVRHILETHFTQIRVEGEASNVKQPASGHVYFTLKDAQAQIRCVCFRTTAMKLKQPIEDGSQLLVSAKVSVYEARGDYQLIINDAQMAGAGALQRAFNALKEKLQRLGWFEAEHKRALPVMPQTVGVITSATGAALRDVLRVLNRRFPATKVIVYPSLVQGAKAADQLIKALQIANERAECAVLLLVRGGGSLEDLSAFNDEALAEVIFHSPIPVVTGVGHQVDFSIADFVADWRAATPSAAAECVSPEQHEFWSELVAMHHRMQQLLMAQIHQWQLHLDALAKRLVHPGERIYHYQMLAQQLRERLQQAMRQPLVLRQEQLLRLVLRLRAIDLQQRVLHQRRIVQDLLQRARHAMQSLLQQRQYAFHKALSSLELLSPLRTLRRGYTWAEKDGMIIKDGDQLQLGDQFKLHFAQNQRKVEVIA